MYRVVIRDASEIFSLQPTTYCTARSMYGIFKWSGGKWVQLPVRLLVMRFDIAW